MPAVSRTGAAWPRLGRRGGGDRLWLPAAAAPHAAVLGDIKGDVATGAVIFVATLAILSLTNRHISKRIWESGLGAVDRSLGFLFGIARGALIVCVLYMAVDWFSPRFPNPVRKSGRRSPNRRG